MSFFRRKLQPAPHRVNVAHGSPDERPTARGVELQPDPAAPEPSSADLRILVVCTANVCRSPLGESLLGAALRQTGVAAVVRSAGVSAAALPVDPRSVAYATTAGATLLDHRARQLAAAVLEADGRDLILGMEREHVREIAMLQPAVLPRSFTLREFVRRASADPAVPGEPLAEWTARLTANRRMQDLLGESSLDDIADPYGRSDTMFREVAADIDRLSALAARLLGGVE